MNPKSSLRLNEYQPVIGFENFGLKGVDEYIHFSTRTDIITNYIGKDKSYLILGCNLGYTAFKTVQDGGSVIGVDLEEHLINFCNDTLKIYYGYNEHNPKFICADAFDYMENCVEKFDCVVALMLFHNILKSHSNEELIQLINIIADKSPCMIMQTRHQPTPGFITTNTHFTQHEKIADGREPIIALRFPLWAFRR
jgi:SAM-dependent methyltransferase